MNSNTENNKADANKCVCLIYWEGECKMSGIYTKHWKSNEPDKVILSFDDDKQDNHYTAGKILDTNTFQPIENRKDHKDFDFEVWESGSVHDIKKYYNTLLYSFYSLAGTRVKNLIVNFDFDNSIIEINGNKRTVIEDFDYTYKVLKTKIKARGGIKGLYNHILDSMNGESCFNCATWHVLAVIGGIEEA